MKRTLLFYLFTIVSLSSCSSFMEVDPQASISGEGVIKDETSAQAALNGAYVALRDYYSINFQSIAYLSGDNVEWTGSQSQVQEFINHKVNPENATIGNTWNGIYTAINRSNNVIKGLEELAAESIENSSRNSILGQAYGIRALSYFDLVRVWGGVPLITEPTGKVGENVGIARSTAGQTYEQVLADLDRAEELLEETTDRFAFTKKTVWALKARYYLYQEDWSQAVFYADKVIDDAQYELLDPYYSFFVGGVTGTKESVFEIAYTSNELNPHNAQWQPQTNGGTRQWAPSTPLIALLSDPSSGGARERLIAIDNQGRWYGNLYYRSPATDPTYVVRIAELYLIRAEAQVELGALSAATQDLNKVRQRAQLHEKSLPAGKEELLLWIEQERRLEFAFEAHRWFDLVRTGRAAAVLGVREDFRTLLPIPYSQILADPALKQNPGYSSL